MTLEVKTLLLLLILSVCTHIYTHCCLQGSPKADHLPPSLQLLYNYTNLTLHLMNHLLLLQLLQLHLVYVSPPAPPRLLMAAGGSVEQQSPTATTGSPDYRKKIK